MFGFMITDMKSNLKDRIRIALSVAHLTVLFTYINMIVLRKNYDYVWPLFASTFLSC